VGEGRGGDSSSSAPRPLPLPLSLRALHCWHLLRNLALYDVIKFYESWRFTMLATITNLGTLRCWLSKYVLHATDLLFQAKRRPSDLLVQSCLILLLRQVSKSERPLADEILTRLEPSVGFDPHLVLIIYRVDRPTFNGYCVAVVVRPTVRPLSRYVVVLISIIRPRPTGHNSWH